MEVKDIMLLASQLVAAGKEVARAEDILKRAKDDERRLREESLPSAMQEAGLTQLKLETGETVTIGMEVYCSIPVARREEAFVWLEQTGNDGLIKTEVAVEYGRGELAAAKQLADELAAKGLIAALSRNVHPQTLKAFVKEQLQGGKNIPLELFGARTVFTARVK